MLGIIVPGLDPSADVGVHSFHSSVDTKVDGLSVETFVFYAEGEDGPSRTELTNGEV